MTFVAVIAFGEILFFYFFFPFQFIPQLTRYYRTVVNMYMCHPRKIVQLKSLFCGDQLITGGEKS